VRKNKSIANEKDRGRQVSRLYTICTTYDDLNYSKIKDCCLLLLMNTFYLSNISINNNGLFARTLRRTHAHLVNRKEIKSNSKQSSLVKLI
jgi:hypothetical protein